MTETRSTVIRVVICRGEYCNLGRRADALLKRLEPEIAAINEAAGQRRVKLEIANCLSMCAAGPNAVIYPDDIVFNRLDAAGLEQVLDQIRALLAASG